MNVLITGASRRIGAALSQLLHQHGMNVILHCHTSSALSQSLCDTLNNLRPGSAHTLQADLADLSQVKRLATQALDVWGAIDVLINNASAFFRTPVLTATEAEWNTLMDTNVKGPFFLSQALVPTLKKQRGCIINILDIHAIKPLSGYAAYSISKAALQMMTYGLAQELAPEVRVNGIAPGSIAWPEGANKMSEAIVADVLSRIALKREGNPEDVAKAALFFIESANYVTGQVLAIDGGRLLNC